MKHSLMLPLFLLLALLSSGARAEPGGILRLDPPRTEALGRYADYLMETGGRLSLEQAVAAYAAGRFHPSRRAIPTFGIGPRPVWLHFRVLNPDSRPLPRRLSVETAWLDQVDVYFLHGGHTEASYHTGDLLPFPSRPVDSRYFVFDHDFAPGLGDLYVRVATADPMVLPIRLMSPAQATSRAQAENYGYGFLYGFAFALLAYNAMLFAGLRDARYILYSLYLGMFLLMNIAYTGHGFAWFWPEQTLWAQWSKPLFMVLFGISGLAFALRFLDMRRHFPRVRKAVIAFMAVTFLLLLAAIVADDQRLALLIAFTFVVLFTVTMLAMGALCLRSGQKPARYFLLAAISAMVGTAVTALAVWGFIPSNVWTYHSVDVGILLDATLLALALTYQFRVGQREKLQAEQLAKLDPLTGADNRRAFYDKATPIWNVTLRHGHPLAVVLLDIDRFKRINDRHGHGCGDDVLVETARVLGKSIRQQDLMARWGGEEFILLLPETGLAEAAALAERVRKAIAEIALQRGDAEIRVTASFGVAQREERHHSLDTLISSADKHLYQAKASGRDRVTAA